jgi:hypothetical protein
MNSSRIGTEKYVKQDEFRNQASLLCFEDVHHNLQVPKQRSALIIFVSPEVEVRAVTFVGVLRAGEPVGVTLIHRL